MRLAGDTIEPISKGRLKAGPAALIGATAVASCDPAGVVVPTDANPANFVYTDELPNTLNDRGLCRRDSFDRVVYEPPIYCYRTLGQITSYDKQDPYSRNSTRVGHGMESPHQWPT